MTRNRPLTRDDWIAAALKVFVERGIDDVKIDNLAKKLRVTRGSFYWHFADRNALLDAILHDWELRNNYEIAGVRTRWARSEPDLSEIVAVWLKEDPGFQSYDMAIRVWARKSADVAQAVHRVDEAWIGLLQDIFRKEGYRDEECFVRARIAYFHQVGYYALAIPESLEDRIKLAPVYYKALSGKEPGEKFWQTIDAISNREPKRKGRRKAAVSEPHMRVL